MQRKLGWVGNTCTQPSTPNTVGTRSSDICAPKIRNSVKGTGCCIDFSSAFSKSMNLESYRYNRSIHKIGLQ